MTSTLEATQRYLDTYEPRQWKFDSYYDEMTKLSTLTKDEAKSLFTTALRNIMNSLNRTRVAKKQAKYLISQLRERSSTLGKRPNQGTIINCSSLAIIPQNLIIDPACLSTQQTTSNNLHEGGKRRRVSRLHPEIESSEDEAADQEYGTEVQNHEEEVQDKVEQESIAASNLTCCYQLRDFVDTFKAIPSGLKLTLHSSGRVLEDVIYAAVIANPATAGDAIDWVIDLKDDLVRQWFFKPELEELFSLLPPTPKADEHFNYACKRYNKKSSIRELHDIAESKPTPPHIPYERCRNHNASYVNVAIKSILSTIEQSATNESFGTPQSHREGWYSKIWSVVLDYCLDDIDNFTVSRTDIKPKAGCDGLRFDAMFLAGGVGVNIAEVGAVEVARSTDVLPGGKRVGDQDKLRKVMKAMVKAQWNDRVGRYLQVVGVQTVGFHLRISTMSALSRTVLVLQPGKWRPVPHKLENFETVFDVLEAVVVMKAIVKRTVEVLRASSNVRTSEFEL